jgi:hypothetical protein
MTYNPPTGPPSGGPTKGATNLEKLVAERYEVSPLGIYNPRDVCGNPWPNWRCAPSAHAEGRAVDFGVTKTTGDALADWLVDNAPDLGVQEVIWYRRRWAANQPSWQSYSGRSPHTDHVHVALTRAAASGSPAPASEPKGTKPMWVIRLVEGDRVVDPTQYVTDFITRRPIADEWELDQLVAAGCAKRDLDHRIAKRIPIVK